MSDSSESGFKTVDRRRFTAEGESKADISADESKKTTGSSKAAGGAADDGLHGETFERQPNEGDFAPPEVTFGTLCLSLHTQALFHMGLLKGPEGEVMPPNPPLARYTIDILHMLRDKTKGNLSEDESQLVNGLIYELQMRFVQVSPRK